MKYVYYKIKEEKKAEIIGEIAKRLKEPEKHNYEVWLDNIEKRKNGINNPPGDYIEIKAYFTPSKNFCALDFSKDWFDEIIEELDEEEGV